MRHDRSEPVRITTASRPRSEEIAGRQRRYLISMGIRTLCFILAVVSMGHWFMWVFVAGSLFLPYIAVVMANAASPADPADPDFGFDPGRRAIGDRPAER